MTLRLTLPDVRKGLTKYADAEPDRIATCVYAALPEDGIDGDTPIPVCIVGQYLINDLGADPHDLAYTSERADIAIQTAIGATLTDSAATFAILAQRLQDGLADQNDREASEFTENRKATWAEAVAGANKAISKGYRVK